MAEQPQSSSTRPEAVRNRRKSGRQTYLSFPSIPMPHGFQMIFKDYDYSSYVANAQGAAGALTGLNALQTRNTAISTDESSIELPFPKALTDANSLVINSFERSFITDKATGVAAEAMKGNVGDLGQAVADTASSALSAVDQFSRQLGANPGEILDKIQGKISGQNIGNAARIATFLLRNSSALPESVLKSINAATGAAINPNETLAFEGVNLKNYSFTWDLFPSNEKDSEQIKQIIRFLKMKTLPRTSDEGLGELAGINLSRAFLKYPSVVMINLLGVKETYWMRFKPALITDMTVDYAPGGSMIMMKGGKPGGVSLTLSFKELSIHTSEDYSNDNNQESPSI